jgi:hypothetical protein
VILGFGGEMGFFIPSDASAIEAAGVGSPPAYDASYARGSTSVSGGAASYAETPTIAASNSFWLHFDFNAYTAATDSTPETLVSFYAGSTEAIRFCYCDSPSETITMKYWNGSAWTTAGSFTASVQTLVNTVDIHTVTNSASGSIVVYFSGTKRLEVTGLGLSGLGGITKVRFNGMSNGPFHGGCRYSQVVMADEATVGMKVHTFYPSGAGATDDWPTGTWASIDEVAYSDGDVITTTTANQDELFTGTLVGTFAPEDAIRAVCVTARARHSATGPQNIQLSIRTGGANFYSSTLSLDAAYGNSINVWETNPNTSVAWTSANITALQFGVKSIA